MSPTTSSCEHFRILIIEDNIGDSQIIENFLSETGNVSFSLVHANTLSDGLEYLKKKEADLILLDCFLPDSQGPKSVARIHVISPDIPIIVLTRISHQQV